MTRESFDELKRRIEDRCCSGQDEQVKEKTMAKLNTVNVIEMADGSVVSLAAYPDTPEGNKEAEQWFKDVANENTGYGMEAIEESLDDGIVEDGTYSVLLVHSTV